MSTVLSFQNVTKRFGRRMAVDDVSFDLREGSTLGIVGESGSGKSTCVRLAVALERPSSGSIQLHGSRYPSRRRLLRQVRSRIGLVFQDPYDSLDPRMTIGDIVAEPLRVNGKGGSAVAKGVESTLAAVGLPDAPLGGYPSQYSGGGRQRIAIARALILEPEVLLCDEPTASLDVSVQAQIVNLLLRLKADRGLSMIFVSHDLDLVQRVADDIVVLYGGRTMEQGPVRPIVRSPMHPYTRMLLSAIPSDHPRRRHLVDGSGREVATATDEAGAELPIDGCVFASRCYKVLDECRAARPNLVGGANGTRHACLFPETGPLIARTPARQDAIARGNSTSTC